MKPIPQWKKNQVFRLLKENVSHREIRDQTGLGLGSISRLRKECEDLPEKSRGGRPPILSKRDIRKICRTADEEKIDNTSQIAEIVKPALGVSVSDQTIRRALQKSGYKAVKKVKKPLLSARHRKQRLEFARTYQEWTVEDWKRVVFSDETKVNRICSDGIQWTWKKDGKTSISKTTKGTVKFGGGNIMVWGCITAHGTGYCTLIEGTMDKHLYKRILQSELRETLKYYKLKRSEIVFQHDNDPKHTSKLVQKWLDDKGYEVLIWPSQSPDMNPIEHIWYQVKVALQKYDTHAKSVNELWERFQDEWNKISKERCLAVIESMPRRLEAVVRAKGWPTKY